MSKHASITFYVHPEHGDVSILDEVVANDERRWILIRKKSRAGDFWIAKDEVFGCKNYIKGISK